jgi:hypothetical protein
MRRRARVAPEGGARGVAEIAEDVVPGDDARGERIAGDRPHALPHDAEVR